MKDNAIRRDVHRLHRAGAIDSGSECASGRDGFRLNARALRGVDRYEKRARCVDERDDRIRGTAERECEFARLVGESQRRVIAIAYGVVGNPEDAEEVAQDAFVRAYRSFDNLRAPDKFCAWINRIVFRLALNHRRARHRRMRRDSAWLEERTGQEQRRGGALVDRMFLDDVRAAIDTLPEKLRVVLLLCAVEELDVSAVAAVLRIPAGTVRSRLHLARKQLLKRTRT